jgi:hypothetical protein
MKKLLLVLVPAVVAAVAITYQDVGYASDHDDGEIDLKGRSLNLTDHFAFKSPAAPDELALIMYFNPRSQPGKQYFMSTNARYDFHVAKVGARTDAGKTAEDFIFRFEAGAPNAAGVQSIKLTLLDGGGNELGSMMGNSTDIANSRAGSITTNTGTIGGMDVRWFVGMRADSFHFDVIRFFQVRSFLAQRLFGGANGNGDAATPSLADNCRGDKFLSILNANPAAGEKGGVSDGDNVNLFNPTSCAPDFTKNLNVTAIVMNVKIAQLGGTIFDTWSSISVLQ